MVEMLSSMIKRVTAGGPEDPPRIMPPKKVNPPPLAAQPKKPENIPGIKDMSQTATVKDEKRRILTGLPKPTEKVFAGENTGSDAVIKKRVLGGGIGRQTTGE